MSKLLTTLALLATLFATLLPSPAAHAADEEPSAGGAIGAVAGSGQIEDYASYAPQTTCHPKPRIGTKVLGRWLVKKIGGGGGATGRSCGGGASEHKDGRAIDWRLDATSKAGRATAQKLLTRIFKTDKDGNAHAKARRMGIMYVIWNDHMYSAWDQFESENYLSSSCPSKKKCSKTLRHRDHMHISLSMAGAKGKTSWYAGRLPG